MTNYCSEDLEKAIKCCRQGMTIGKAATEYKVPKSTLWRKLNGKQSKQSGGQLSLTTDCETGVVSIINELTDWKVPLDGYDVRLLVKHYLDKRGVSHQRFTNNIPGNGWLRGFILRHNLAVRFADNVKPPKFQMGEVSINSFFDRLDETLRGVSPDNIFNFDETNLTDDPSRKKCIVRRGLRRVEKKTCHSKQAFSVMFAGNATGNYLAPMVVYKVNSENMYEGWREGGPPNAVYKSTQSGWFDTTTFEIWFFQVFLPFAQKLNGPKVLLGDNLGSHFSVDVVRSCQMHDIRFTTLLPNTTHILQPLDVAVFRPLKVIWRQVLQDWRSTGRNSACIPKESFPPLLHRVIRKLNPQHLKSGFEATGIYPLDRNKVLCKLPGNSKDPGGSDTVAVLNESCIEILREHCKPPVKTKRNNRGKKVTVIPGKPLELYLQTEDAVTWVCQHHQCKKSWKEDSNRWIVCDICDASFHLQCSGKQYETKDYYEVDIAGESFECDSCS
jgi:hypothetical protein